MARPDGRGPRRGADDGPPRTTTTRTSRRDGAAMVSGPDAASTSSSTSPVATELVGRLVTARVDHAGPYALRGTRRRGVTGAPPLARHRRGHGDRQDRARDRRGRATGRRRAGRPRSSRPTRARSTAASTSGRPRSTAAERARVPHHGLDLVDPDEPFSVADFAAHARRRSPRSARAAASRSSSAAPGSTCGPSPAASPTEALPSDAAVRARTRGGARARTASTPLVGAPAIALAPERGRARSTCATRGGSCAPSRSPSCAGDAPLPRAASATRARRVDRAGGRAGVHRPGSPGAPETSSTPG